MLLREQLQVRLSKYQVISLANEAGITPELLDELIDCLSDENIQIVKSAAWTIGHSGQLNPNLVEKHIESLLVNLQNPSHPSVTRNILRILQYIKIPEVFQGRIYDLCFQYIINPKTPVAIRAFSMTICAHISEEHSELKNELALALQDVYVHDTPGIKSRVRHTLKLLNSNFNLSLS